MINKCAIHPEEELRMMKRASSFGCIKCSREAREEVTTTHDIEANGKRYVMEWGDDWIQITECDDTDEPSDEVNTFLPDRDNPDLETYDFKRVRR